MPTCQNLQCGKQIPEGLNFCSKECKDKAQELREQTKQNSTRKTGKLSEEESLWLGQDRRKRAMETILRLARELLPMFYKKFACIISYRTGLSLRKITDDYLEVLLELGLLRRKGNLLIIGGAESS